MPKFTPPIQNIVPGAQIRHIRSGKDTKTNLRDRPLSDRKHCNKITVHDGEFVTIMQPLSYYSSTECFHRADGANWYWVRTSNNSIGWLKADHLEKRVFSHAVGAHAVGAHAVGAHGIQVVRVHPHVVGAHGIQVLAFPTPFIGGFHGFTH